jgi:hypothetical protein
MREVSWLNPCVGGLKMERNMKVLVVVRAARLVTGDQHAMLMQHVLLFLNSSRSAPPTDREQ